jgi:hypothetical protein
MCVMHINLWKGLPTLFMLLGDKELLVFPFLNFLKGSFKYGRPFFGKQKGVTFVGVNGDWWKSFKVYHLGWKGPSL